LRETSALQARDDEGAGSSKRDSDSLNKSLGLNTQLLHKVGMINYQLDLFFLEHNLTQLTIRRHQTHLSTTPPEPTVKVDKRQQSALKSPRRLPERLSAVNASRANGSCNRSPSHTRRTGDDMSNEASFLLPNIISMYQEDGRQPVIIRFFAFLACSA
jgi:hypothetical protein